MRLYDLRTEYRINPIGLTVKAPRFSWKMESDKKNTLQNSYQIIVKAQEKMQKELSGTAVLKRKQHLF